MKPTHRRHWRRLWRYCSCGLRWRCPDSGTGAPRSFSPPGLRNQRRRVWTTRPDNRGRAYPHQPQRPLWICRRCAQPWPCGQAKLDLRREFGADRAALRIHLTNQMYEALRDRYALTPYEMLTPAEVWHRFLAWTEPPPTAD
ncbi:hypothetical protein O7627_34830 [Solwaraspora sp. WMMD1047]|uniref:hypothetical protein n=1 Tax=Solwaraspora sp. WMMD1047 TaxID=3016102 RepID=UPI0024161D66|nr:hypothetical protein [Solwaraspora sp. WMMD1047]MDG4834446.1 hypothetical protein [Solwaraspora sp. WMMD1047]